MSKYNIQEPTDGKLFQILHHAVASDEAVVGENPSTDVSATKRRGSRKVRDLFARVILLLGRKAQGLVGRVRLLSGDDDVMRRMWSAAGTSDPSENITRAKLRNKNTLLIIAVGLAVSLALCVLNLKSPELPDMTRNSYGGITKKIDAEVTAEYGSETVKKKVSVGVLAAEADAAEIAGKLANLQKRLPSIILGNNESLRDVRYDLNLIDRDAESGAAILWSSDTESALTSEGRVNHIEGKKGDKVGLRANIRLGEASDSVYIDVIIGDPPTNYDFSGDIERSVSAVAAEVSGESSGDSASLPERTDGGVKLTWKPVSDNIAFFTPLIFIILGAVVYIRRYAVAGREIAAARESVERDFPDFLDKLLLLLNAGVVISSAISKIADDYRERAELIIPAPNAEKPSRVSGKSGFLTKVSHKIGRKGSATSNSDENSRSSSPDCPKSLSLRGALATRLCLRRKRLSGNVGIGGLLRFAHARSVLYDISRKPKFSDSLSSNITPNNSASRSYFYEELCRMEDRIRSSRVSLISEFSDLAVKSGRREVMRFSAILADNIDKGNALGEKLTQESGALWDMRKKSAEKKGRIAETKLTFPMVLQLLAIILITIAPAMIEMR
jgi:hypothetical protein